MRFGFAAGQILLEDEPRPMIETAADRFDHWEVTGEGPLGDRAGLEAVEPHVDVFDLALTYHAAFREVDLADGDPHRRAEHVARIADQLRWARDLGAAAAVVHPGRTDTAGAVGRARTSLGRLADRARDLGIELRVENMPAGRGELGAHPRTLAGIARGTTDAVCLDLGHLRTLDATVEGTVDLDPVDDLVHELHVHANDGTGDRHEPVTGDATWLVPWLERFRDRDVVAVFEHRYVEECIASLDAVEALMHDAVTG